VLLDDTTTHTKSRKPPLAKNTKMNPTFNISFATRLHSFEDQWPHHQTTARQLAALGHVCDRPPLESLEEGSRCIDCGLFLPKQPSIEALEGSLTSSSPLTFHKPKCPRLQIRMPLEASRATLDYSSAVAPPPRAQEPTQNSLNKAASSPFQPNYACKSTPTSSPTSPTPQKSSHYTATRPAQSLKPASTAPAAVTKPKQTSS
jgi:hypothetical protein